MHIVYHSSGSPSIPISQTLCGSEGGPHPAQVEKMLEKRVSLEEYEMQLAEYKGKIDEAMEGRKDRERIHSWLYF
jgi:hypothetical protein